MRRKIPVFVSLTFLMVSCGLNPFNSDKPDPDDRFYQIKVDSVTVASPLRVSDTMHVRFHGWAGSGCSTFSHIDVTRIDLVGYKVSLWGKHNRHAGPCPGTERYLNRILLEFLSSSEGWHVDLFSVSARRFYFEKGGRSPMMNAKKPIPPHVAIMGPSGCGKSTLLNLLGMLDKPHRGRVFIWLYPDLSKAVSASRAAI